MLWNPVRKCSDLNTYLNYLVQLIDSHNTHGTGDIKYRNELSNSIKCGVFRDKLSNYKFLKRHSATGSFNIFLLKNDERFNKYVLKYCKALWNPVGKCNYANIYLNYLVQLIESNNTQGTGDIKHGNELSNSINCGVFRDRLSKYKFLKRHSAPGSFITFLLKNDDLQNLFWNNGKCFEIRYVNAVT